MGTSTTAAADVTSDDVFALLDHVLDHARARLRREAKPITFELAPTGETWRFDPTASGALFVRGAAFDDDAVLRLRCAPALLARLVTDAAFTLQDEDDASYEGDLDDLLLLVAAFEDTKNALGIRAMQRSS